MSIYKYKCSHEQFEALISGVKRCMKCNMIVITDHGVWK